MMHGGQRISLCGSDSRPVSDQETPRAANHHGSGREVTLSPVPARRAAVSPWQMKALHRLMTSVLAPASVKARCKPKTPSPVLTVVYKVCPEAITQDRCSLLLLTLRAPVPEA